MFPIDGVKHSNITGRNWPFSLLQVTGLHNETVKQHFFSLKFHLIQLLELIFFPLLLVYILLTGVLLCLEQKPYPFFCEFEGMERECFAYLVLASLLA